MQLVFPRILKKIALKEPREPLEKADLRHIRTSAYCCFLPDLTRFTASHCAGPKPCQAKLFKGNFYFQSVYPSCRNFHIAMASYSICHRNSKNIITCFSRQVKKPIPPFPKSTVLKPKYKAKILSYTLHSTSHYSNTYYSNIYSRELYNNKSCLSSGCWY